MIEIEYIVKDKKGVEKLRTADKKAADAYDKALDNADLLQQLLRHDNVLPKLKDEDMETLTIYLALNAKNVDRALKGREPEYDAPSDESDESSNVASIKDAAS
ncbi:MAG: YebG family protein [Psychrobium sp.]|nr:YebG family protein [Psychrobium sp.]